jgi:tripartite-type tricarboxylate transporter receptor subunit TctC
MFQRHRLTIAMAAIGVLLSAGAGAQDYPTKPITLIVPWPAGGSTDIAMRAIADSASKQLGQPVAIDNKAGGGGTVGPATMPRPPSRTATRSRNFRSRCSACR